MTERDDDWGTGLVGWMRQVVTIAIGVFLGLMLTWFVARAYIHQQTQEIEQRNQTTTQTTGVVKP
jgi:hypothetical protein